MHARKWRSESESDHRHTGEDQARQAPLKEKPDGTCAGKPSELEEEKMIEITERDFLHSQKMEAIGTLAGGIAHDFNNLLMIILGNVSLLRLQLHGGTPPHDLLDKIEQAANTGAQLTRKLLGFARKGKYHIEQVDLNVLVRESLSILSRTRKDVVVQMDLAMPLWKASVDKCQMEQVILNLIVNAFEAMPASGRLCVRTRNVPAEEAKKTAGHPALVDCVLVEVSDTGIGMDPQTLKRVFNPYFSTKTAVRGAGLSLASALGIVKNHGGHISVASTKGKGSMFSVLLPADRTAACEEKTPACSPAPATVLVVDDEEIVLETVTKMLERLGYNVIPAAGGQEALELFGQHSDRIGVVLLDFVMPGIRSTDILRQIKGSRPEVKVVFSSGYSLDNLQEQDQTKGSDGFIAKPYTMAALSKTVQSVLEKKTEASFSG